MYHVSDVDNLVVHAAWLAAHRSIVALAVCVMALARQFSIEEHVDEDGVINVKRPMKFRVDVS